ncbi:MAG: hypothetical protein HZB12_00295 [Candidatus Yonathbacteria bacterium]|nr:hypothetical protein [Candidatus Yonathbacteria bacterium]
MQTTLLHILTFTYGTTGVVGAIAYWPTIKDVYTRKPSANVSSYLMWTLTTAITLLYSIFILPDPFFIFVSTTNFAACVLILMLRLRKN